MGEKRCLMFKDVKPGEFFILRGDSSMCSRVFYKQHDGRADVVGGVFGLSTQKVPVRLVPFGRAVSQDEEVIILHPCTFEAK